MKKSDRVATAIFRVIVGIIGLTVPAIAIKWKLYVESLHTFLMFGGFCGLLLGYALGGDKWGARLFMLFTGHRVPDPEK